MLPASIAVAQIAMSRSNNDFRALLLSKSAGSTATAAATTSTTNTSSTTSTSTQSNAERAQAKEARRQHFAAKHRKQQQREDDNGNNNNKDVAMATQYRDRAAERRQGKVIDGVDEAARVDASKFTEDESKHLGGDVEHTHLVKGLDFTLLARVRAQQQQENVPMVTDDNNNIDNESTTNVPVRRKKKLVAVSDDSVASRTALGKGVLKALFGEPPTHNPRMFPGHMYYSFDLAAKMPPLPKAVVRAKADVPALAYEMSSVEKLVLARVSHAVADSRDPSIRARKAAAVAARVAADAAAEAAALAAARRAEEEADEDIFADAGTYVAAVVTEEVVSVAQQPIGATLFEAELRDAQLADEQRAADTAALYEEMDDAYPNTDDAYPNTDDAYPNTDDAYPNTDDAYPNTDDAYPNTDDAYPNTDNAYPKDGDDGSLSLDDVDVADDEDADERARKLLVARGLAVAEDEYGMIGMSNSTLPSVFGGDDDEDGDGVDLGGKKKREMSSGAKAKQDEKQRESKFDRDLKTVAKMVDKKATDRGAKRLIGEHTGANEKKRNRK